jgi:hypothetical protein
MDRATSPWSLVSLLRSCSSDRRITAAPWAAVMGVVCRGALAPTMALVVLATLQVPAASAGVPVRFPSSRVVTGEIPPFDLAFGPAPVGAVAHDDVVMCVYDAAPTRADERAGVLSVADSDALATQSEANVVMGRKGVSKTFVDESGRSTTVKYGGEMIVEPGTNLPGVVNGRAYSAHAFDQMQGRGIMPSVVDDTIATGAGAPSRGATTVYYGASNDISVVVNAEGKVVTVSYGDLRP